jgi:hypothetical protein
VGNDQNTSLKFLESGDKSGEGLSVEIVSGLIKTDDVGSSPGSGGKDDLDLLSTRETSHRVVRSEFGLETEIFKVLFDFSSNQRSHQTQSLSFSGVELEDLLLETSGNELVSGHPHVFGGRETLESNLVLVRLLELLSGNELVNDSLDTFLDDVGSFLHLGLLFGGHGSVGLVKFFEIFTGLVSPKHVLERGRVEVVINVVESVLGNVTDDQVGVLPHGTTEVRLGLGGQDLDQSRFTGTVGTQDGDSGRKRDLERDVVQLLLRRSRVLERNISHLHQCLLLGLDTIKERRVGELELVVLGNIQLEVGSGLGNVTDKGLEVTGISLELEVVQV